MLDLVELMSEISQCEITPKFGPAREGDIYRSMLSNQKAKLGLDWVPQVSLKEGLQRTLNYFIQI